MEVTKKRFVQLVVAITAFVLFTGCNRNIIEHQFHVDIEEQKESMTKIIDAQEIVETFEAYLKQQGFDAKIILLTDVPEDVYGSYLLSDVLYDSISQERLNQWINDPKVTDLCIYTECEIDGELHEQLSIMMNHINIFYTALQEFGDDWANGEALQGKTEIYVLNAMVEKDGKYYLESTFRRQ